jgi:leader peptidase (prepilin peptidase)/N-methyltransferase
MNPNATPTDETYPPAMPREGAQDGRSRETPGSAAESLAPRMRLAATLTSVALAVAALAHFGIGGRGLIAAALCAVLTFLAAYDLDQRRIPNQVVLPAAAAVLVAQIAVFPDDAVEWIVGGLGAALLFFLPAALRAGSIGMGDVKLALLIGVGLGLDVITALFLGSLAAAPVAGWILITKGRGEVIAFGPFLALGAVVTLFLT